MLKLNPHVARAHFTAPLFSFAEYAPPRFIPMNSKEEFGSTTSRQPGRRRK